MSEGEPVLIKASELVPRESTVKYDPKHKCFDLLESGDIGYYIHASRCCTPLEVLGWVRHIAPKEWCSTDTITDLLNAIEANTLVKLRP